MVLLGTAGDVVLGLGGPLLVCCLGVWTLERWTC